MSENFLSFIVNASPKAADAGTGAPADLGQDVSQDADFKGILIKEKARAQSAKTTEQPAAGAAIVPTTEPEVDADTSPSQLEADSLAPVDLPDAATNGNPLPELSIHSRALQVGRVILTTANPKVSEESLSEFARAQGGLIPNLKPLDALPTATSSPIPPTASLLHGQVNIGEKVTPSELSVVPVPAGIQASASADATAQHIALDARQRFMQQANMSGDMLATMDAKTANLKPESDEMITKSSEALAQTG